MTTSTECPAICPTELIDVLTLSQPEQLRIFCLDDGFVRLHDVMPRMVPNDRKTCEHTIVEADRVSYTGLPGNQRGMQSIPSGKGLKTPEEDARLVCYMLRNGHTSPFEHVKFTFHMRLPVFIARQINRHRTANINELSQRYTKIKPNFYQPLRVTPEQVPGGGVRAAGGLNKQSSTISDINLKQRMAKHQRLTELTKEIFHEYHELIALGEAKETARVYLSTATYTEEYWTMDLHNLLKFIRLRADEHAQAETQVYAEAMLKLITPLVPTVIQAFNDYQRGAISLSATEIKAIKDQRYYLKSNSKSAEKEYDQKLKQLGLNFTRD